MLNAFRLNLCKFQGKKYIENKRGSSGIGLTASTLNYFVRY